MAYELEVYPDAGEQIDTLPPGVRSALDEAMIVLTYELVTYLIMED